MDDIAKLYDVSQHPDVQSGKRTEKEAYLEFMKLWDTQKVDDPEAQKREEKKREAQVLRLRLQLEAEDGT